MDFLANTTGTLNSLATMAAMPMPLASMVSTLLMGLPANRRFHSFAISRNSGMSIWWLIKLSTFSTLPSRTMPSLRIRSSSIFIMNQFLQPIRFSVCNGEHCCILFHLVYRNADIFTRGFLAKSDKNCTAVSGTQPKCGPLFKSAETCGGRRTILHFSALVLSAKSSILKIIIDVPAGSVPRPTGEGELL